MTKGDRFIVKPGWYYSACKGTIYRNWFGLFYTVWLEVPYESGTGRPQHIHKIHIVFATWQIHKIWQME